MRDGRAPSALVGAAGRLPVPVGLGALAVTAAVLSGKATRYIDRPVRSFITEHDPHLPLSLLKAVVRAGDSEVLFGAATAATLACGLIYRSPERPVRLVGGCLTGAVVLTVLKRVIDRSGSYNLSSSEGPGHFAYPSGHVASLLLVVGMVTWALAPGTSPMRRSAAVTVGTTAAAVEGAGLLLLQQHWLTDVVGAWLFGWLWLLLCTTPLRRGSGPPTARGPSARTSHPD